MADTEKKEAATNSKKSANLAKKLMEISNMSVKTRDGIAVVGEEAVKKIVRKPKRRRVKPIKPTGLQGLQGLQGLGSRT